MNSVMDLIRQFSSNNNNVIVSAKKIINTINAYYSTLLYKLRNNNSVIGIYNIAGNKTFRNHMFHHELFDRLHFFKFSCSEWLILEEFLLQYIIYIYINLIIKKCYM